MLYYELPATMISEIQHDSIIYVYTIIEYVKQ